MPNFFKALESLECYAEHPKSCPCFAEAEKHDELCHFRICRELQKRNLGRKGHTGGACCHCNCERGNG